MSIRWAWLWACSWSCFLPTANAFEFEIPQQVMAGGEPVDVQRKGHSAPFLGDFDGDGRHDLFVGEFFEGRLRIFRNVGTRDKPAFDQYTWFRAGGELGRVPSG